MSDYAAQRAAARKLYRSKTKAQLIDLFLDEQELRIDAEYASEQAYKHLDELREAVGADIDAGVPVSGDIHCAYQMVKDKG